ncbi:unnamed protein product [Chrysoparadoxa australica]
MATTSPPLKLPSARSAGVYELQLRRRLLKQQLELVNQKCDTATRVVQKKLRRKGQQWKSSSFNDGKFLPGRASSCPELTLAVTQTPHDDDGQQQHHSPTASAAGAHTQLAPMRARPRRGRGPASRELPVIVPEAVKQALAPAKMFKPGGQIEQKRAKGLLKSKMVELDRAKAAKMSNAKSKVVVEPVHVQSLFPQRYMRGEVPCSIDTRGLSWLCPFSQLDYDYYLPMFFEGIRCLEDPCKFIARQGVLDLLEGAKGDPNRVLPSLKEIIKSIRHAVSTRNPDVLVYTCKAIAKLAETSPQVGEELVRYYRIFLNVLNHFTMETRNLGDAMDYKQNKGGDLGECVNELLQKLERTGGKNAFVNIKICVPTYESCI